MRKDGSRLLFSPSDLINFMSSEFVTWMDRFYKEYPGAIEPDADTEEDKIIQDKGLEHERAFLGLLAAQGRRPRNARSCSRPLSWIILSSSVSGSGSIAPGHSL